MTTPWTGQRHRDVDHRPVPGPQYWDWRCLVCGEPVRDHPSWWRRTREALRDLVGILGGRW